MKTSVIKLSLLSVLSIGAISACQSPAQKLNQAQENSTEANLELEKANDEYLNEVETYRQEMAQRIETNNKSIVDFKSRINKQKAEAKEDYKNKIADLEQKNSDYKKRMDKYKATGKENWEQFKAEFSHDMDELGSAFEDLIVNNVK